MTGGENCHKEARPAGTAKNEIIILHLLAKGFGLGVTEYKEIAARLHEQGVLSDEQTRILEVLAGYQNRMVHFYHEVSQDELYEICSNKLSDVEMIGRVLQAWLKAHPEKLDTSL
jgi:uncharacterized protein YutE (UPF0331/DUF86 family)